MLDPGTVPVGSMLLCAALGVLAVRPASSQPGEAAFELGEIVVIGQRPEALSSVGGTVVTREQTWTFEKFSLDRALDLAPGVVSTVRGRRNESDIFVRGFGRWQVPLMVDGVRIYLPADNRIDFGRFLTADIEAVQIQKGYASVLDGPGAMGGAINLVTGAPSRPYESEGGVVLSGDGADGWSGYLVAGARRQNHYVRGSATYRERDAWSLSDDYVPAPGSLEDGGERQGSDTRDWRVNVKIGFTPNDTDEYTLNLTKQAGEKGAPLNVYNNPPVPASSYWRWPYWDVQNASFLTATRVGDSAYIETKTYYSRFETGLAAYDDITYTTQSSGRASFSRSDDHAYGVSLELGTTRLAASTLKAALHFRKDVHTERRTRRPTHPSMRFTEPEQTQAQKTWSLAAESVFHASAALDWVVGLSYDDYRVTKAEAFDAGASRAIFEHPKGGADAVNWQSALIWRYRDGAQLHASVSSRGRFPTFFELYSTRFGTATPNPDLGPERATNLELGWEADLGHGARVGGALFNNDVDDLIQTVVLPDTTTQAQNVGRGRFRGLEAFFDARLSDRLSVGGNYTYIDLGIEDTLQPALRADGVPTHKLFLHATWRPRPRWAITPSVEAADDRWSRVNPGPPAYLETGAYTLLGVDASYTFESDLELAVGVDNALDEHYELAWGFPQPGRSVFLKARMTL